jgi:heterodisulfide reductase subunit A-like polyferredoxin
MEKKAAKAGRMLAKLEKKYGEDSETFYKGVSAGQHRRTRIAKNGPSATSRTWRLPAPWQNCRRSRAGFTTAKKLAFVQCVGSRDFRFYPFCSGYCCMHSIKEAIIAHEHEPETTSTIFGMDIRAVGKGFEEYKVRGGNNSNIAYIRGRVARSCRVPTTNPWWSTRIPVSAR